MGGPVPILHPFDFETTFSYTSFIAAAVYVDPLCLKNGQ